MAVSEDVLVGALVAALGANVSSEILAVDQREPAAQEFLEFVGRLLAVVEGQQPSPAKGAAFLWVIDHIGLGEASEEAAQVMMTFVEGMNIARKVLLERKAKGGS